MRDLPRKLNLFDGAALLVGTAIGSGIFVVPSLIAQPVPEPGLVIAIWVFSGLLVLCGARTLAELGTMLPQSGGLYVAHSANWIFFTMVVLSVMVLRRRHPEWPRPYRVAGYPFTVLVFVVVSSAFMVNTLVESARSSLLGLGLLAPGVPAYAWSRRRQDDSQPVA